MVLLLEGLNGFQPTLPAMALGKPSRPRRAARRFRRFVVAEDSMMPTLRPGDGLVAMRSDRIRRGEIRIFEHPGRPGFWLVKRVGHVRADRFEALSDNAGTAAVDSRRFGDVPIAGSYRMLLRVPSAISGR
jgi:hypothetical protein